MRRAAIMFAVLPILASTACERTPNDLLMTAPNNRPLRLTTPDAWFSLTPDQRTRVLPFFDVEALERLLGMVQSEARDPMLRFFLAAEKKGPHAMLTEVDDPQLQAVLEEVWAPYWKDLPDEVLDKEQAPLPGREVERRLRAARRRGQEGKRPPE
jgi:hypothetical protein